MDRFAARCADLPLYPFREPADGALPIGNLQAQSR
jgi:hypothetical protein